MFCKIYLNFAEQYSFKVDRDTTGFASVIITLLISSYSIFNSCYLNNKVTCEKFDVLLYATFGRPLDVQISLLSTWLQWTEKGRPMDVQYGTWTDGPNKDVHRTSDAHWELKLNSRNQKWAKLCHHPPSSTTTCQNISTTTHHHPTPAKIYPLTYPTNHRQTKCIHHHEQQSKIYPSKKLFHKKNISV